MSSCGGSVEIQQTFDSGLVFVDSCALQVETDDGFVDDPNSVEVNDVLRTQFVVVNDNSVPASMEILVEANGTQVESVGNTQAANDTRQISQQFTPSNHGFQVGDTLDVQVRITDLGPV